MAFFSPGVIIGAMGSISGQIDEAREENKKLAEDYKKKAEAAFGVVREQARARNVSDQEFTSVTERVMSQTKAGKASFAKMTPLQRVRAGEEISKTQKNNPDAPVRVLANRIVAKYNDNPSIFGKALETPEGTQGIPKKESTFMDRVKDALVGSASQDEAITNMVPASMQQQVQAEVSGQEAPPRGTTGPGAGLNRLTRYFSATEASKIFDNTIESIVGSDVLVVDATGKQDLPATLARLSSDDGNKNNKPLINAVNSIMTMKSLNMPVTEANLSKIVDYAKELGKIQSLTAEDRQMISDDRIEDVIKKYKSKKPEVPTKGGEGQVGTGNPDTTGTEKMYTKDQVDEIKGTNKATVKGSNPPIVVEKASVNGEIVYK
jgi:hypothetical protein